MTRAVVGLIVLALFGSKGSLAQTPDRPRLPERIGGTPTVAWEHGDPAMAFPPVLGVGGLVVYDIATAASSARLYNARNPAVPKSPSTAFVASLASTGVPLVVGSIVTSSSPEMGIPLIAGGLVFGPSVGHWYAGRVGRGLATAGLRAGLGLLGGLALLAAS